MLYPPVPICVKSCPVALSKEIATVISAVAFSANPAHIYSSLVSMFAVRPAPDAVMSNSSVNSIIAQLVKEIVAEGSAVLFCATPLIKISSVLSYVPVTSYISI